MGDRENRIDAGMPYDIHGRGVNVAYDYKQQDEAETPILSRATVPEATDILTLTVPKGAAQIIFSSANSSCNIDIRDGVAGSYSYFRIYPGLTRPCKGRTSIVLYNGTASDETIDFAFDMGAL